MFFKKERKIKIVYVIVACFSAFVIFSAILIIVFLFAKNNEKVLNSGDAVVEKADEETETRVLSPLELVENYKKELLNLKSRVENEERGKDEMLADAEQIFLSISVPDEFRSLHLQNFLKIKEIQKNSNDFLKEEIINEISGLIDEILKFEIK